LNRRKEAYDQTHNKLFTWRIQDTRDAEEEKKSRQKGRREGGGRSDTWEEIRKAIKSFQRAEKPGSMLQGRGGGGKKGEKKGGIPRGKEIAELPTQTQIWISHHIGKQPGKESFQE